MTLTDEGKQLRAEVAVLQRGRGRKYPRPLRERILDWVDRAVAAGWAEADCGAAIGVPMHRFELWRESDRAREAAQVPAAMVPIEVTGSLGQLVVVAASGDRVEGLTFEQVIALLRALR